MPKNTAPVNATGLPTSRRSILRGLAVLPVGAAAVSSRPAAAAVTSSPALVMWRDVLKARTATEEASRAYKAAQDRLPWWAKPGPSLVNHKGEFSGQVMSSPAKQNHGLPDEGVFRVIRVSAHDINQHCGLFDGPAGDAARERRMAELNERIAAQKVEERKVGLDVLEARWDAENVDLCNAEDAITALEPTTLDVVAAQILVTAVQDCCTTDTAKGAVGLGIAALALRGLLPHLTGELAEDAAEVVNFPDRPISAMRISTGYTAAVMA